MRNGVRAGAGVQIEVAGRTIPVVPLDATAKELPGWLGQPHLVVALELDGMLACPGLIESLSFHHGDIDVISPLKGLPINNTRVSHFFSRDILSLRIHNNLARPWPQLVKRGFDLVMLTADIACRFDQHLAKCPPCKTYVDTYRTTVNLAKEACCPKANPQLAKMPPELLTAILHAIQSDKKCE
mgnify:CR=1 FL=1